MSSKEGYDADFLGSSLPLPSFSKSLSSKVLERDSLSPDPTGRNTYRHYHNYTLTMSREHRTALFVALNIDQSLLETTDHTEGWRLDSDVGKEYQLNDDYYSNNDWDRGHLAPDASAGWGPTPEERVAATNDTYYYTNATLQHENFNRDEWKDLETFIRKSSMDHTDRLTEITGPVFLSDAAARYVEPEGRDPARIPDGFFKVLAYVNKTSKVEVQCFVVWQDIETLEDRMGEVHHEEYQVDLSRIEELTGLIFDPAYHEANKLAQEDEEVDPSSTAGVAITAAMVNPAGKDSGNEWISLRNTGSAPVSVEGWILKDQAGRTLTLPVGDPFEGDIMIYEIKPVRLNNTGGALFLHDGNGKLVHKVKYTKAQVKEGVAVEF